VLRSIEMLLAELMGRVAIGNSNVDVYYSIFHLQTFILLPRSRPDMPHWEVVTGIEASHRWFTFCDGVCASCMCIVSKIMHNLQQKLNCNA
jgi:hypothetical protein